MKAIKIFSFESNFKVNGIPVQPITWIELNNAIGKIRHYSRGSPADKNYVSHRCRLRVQRYYVGENLAEYGKIEHNGNSTWGIVLHPNGENVESLERKLGLHKD